MTTEEKILECLQQILRVTALQVGADSSMTERAKLLRFAGLDVKTIAEVLGTTPESIYTLTARSRRPKGRRG